jgi:predicted O-methyltransferase YrrM
MGVFGSFSSIIARGDKDVMLKRFRRRASTKQDKRSQASNPFLVFAPPGHFYSPLPDIDLIDRDKETLFDRRVECIPGIDNEVEDQLALLARFAAYYDEMPFKEGPSDGLRYYFVNPQFSYGDAIILYSMLRHYQPRKVIEVGAGFSSAVMLDTNDRFLSKRMAFTFIEPHPERLLSLLHGADKEQHEIMVDIVQNAPLALFDTLEANDILFIDSSHVVKIGSDVVHLVTKVLPRLKKGVLIHVHDIFWPFEYPEVWLREGRAWNELYLVKAFLQYNTAFKIRFFNSYLAHQHRKRLQQHLPLLLKNPGGSLWLEKIG